MITNPDGYYCFAADCDSPVLGEFTFCRYHFEKLPRTFQRVLDRHSRVIQDYRKRFDPEYLIALRDARNFLKLRTMVLFAEPADLAVLDECTFCNPMRAVCPACGRRRNADSTG